MQPSIDIQGFRLSPQQKRLWTLQQTLGTAYMQGTMQIRGVLDVVRLERAVDAAVAKHEAFRTLFCREPGVKVPLQVVVEESKPAWETVELQAEDAAAQATKWEELLEDHRRQAIDWEQGSLVRCTLCRLSDREHWLLISLPAMCADARALHNLAGEIADGYGVVGRHEPDDEPVQYAQFAEWQNELLAEEDAAKGRQFWREVLADSAPINLPFEQTGEKTAGWPTETFVWNLDTEVATSLLVLSERLETPVDALILAAWQTVLCRVGGRREYLMALLSDGRKYDELESGMGLFAKWVPLRCRVDPDKSFQELAAAVATDQHHVREWQEYFVWDSAAAGTGPATTELVGFEFETAKPLASIADVVFSFEPAAVRFEPLKLILSCMRRNRSIQLCLQADPRLVHAAALPILSDALTALLTAAAAQPEAGVGLLPLLGESQRHRLLQAGRGAMRPVSADRSVQSLFENQAAARPDAIAVVCGDRRLTYAELNERANQIAHGLNRMGVGRGALVGLCVDRSVEMVAGLLGVLKAGAAYVPLDPENSMARLTFEVSQAGIAVVLTQEKWLQRLPTTETPVHCLDFHDWTFTNEPSNNPHRAVHPMELAYVIYTSGSTGVPKGVAVTHLGVLNYTDFICRALPAESNLNFATVSTLGADLGNTVIFASLASGGCLHVIGYDRATDGRQFGDYCAKHPIDVLKIVPAHFQSLLTTAEGGEVLPRRLLVLGGDVLSPGLADQVTAAGRCRVLNHYGPTETTIGCLTFPVDPRHEAATLSATVPIGRSIDNAEAYILDERLDPVPVGVPGELYLGGAGLARGYLGRPDLTAQRFIPHPLASEPGSRLYKTGDLARFLPDGTVEFLGRTDFQIKLRGYRIELGEIEACLTEHVAVQQAVVTARANQAGERYLAAYIIPRDSAGEPAGWREFLKERLPDYMIPTALVCLPALPLNQNGKVDRALLPDPEAYLASSRRYVAPRNPAEEMLTGIWETILKRDRIGIHDNFFDLGGHSLLATQVMARVRSVFRVEVPLRTVFEATAVAKLAEAIEKAKRGEHDGNHAPPPIVPTVRNGPIPLSFAQQRLWVLAQLDPDSVAYNIPIALRVRGQLDLDALQNSFNAVIRRHEALRTVFQTCTGVPMQVVAESLALSVPLIDLRHLASEAREEAAVRLAAVEAQRPFDLKYGPLLRVNLIRIDESEHVLLLTLHHIVSDAWSAQVLVREVTLLYAAFVAGEQPSLPDLPLQYADFSQWQHAWMSDAVLERESAYWKASLGGDLPILDLPTDRSRPALQSSRGALLTRLMSLDISNQVVELSRRMGATLYMTLLTGFVLLLHRWTGQRDLIVGTPIANRTHNELESLIGFFVNTLAIRTQVPRGATVADMIGRVRATCLDAYSHQDMPFEKLVEVLQPKRDIGRSPIFQVMFDLQNAPAAELNVPGLDFTPLEIDNTMAKFDLSMTVQETEMGLSCSIEYNRDLFEETTIMGMLAQYEHLLKGMAAEPDSEVSRVHLMSQENRERILSGGRSEPMTDPVGSIHEMIERQVQRSPDAPAIQWQNRTFSYREVNAKANQLARYLRGQGIGPEQRVGICMERCPEMIMTLLGILKAGGTYVPIDPTYPPDRQINLGSDAGLSLVVTHGSCMENRDAYPFTILPYERIQGVTQTLSQDDLGSIVAPHQAAYIIYTSGSTGKPKGVVISHQAVSLHVLAAAAQYGIQASDRILQFASLSFDVAAEELLCAFFHGATIVLQPCRLFETIPAFLDFLRRERVSVVGLPASYWQLWMAEANEPGRDVPDHLRVLIVGNEAVSAEHLAVWKKKAAERVRWLNAYGPTEATITTTTYETDRAYTPTGPGIVPIGKPLSGRLVYVLDEMLEPVPYGVPGELCIGGASLARGYLHDPIQTGTSFLPDPFCDKPGSRLYRTGDRVRLRHDNVIEFLGRIDDQVKVRGFRVEPGEIETVLSRHPDVQEAAVLVRRNPEGRDMLVAYVRPQSERDIEDASLRKWIGLSLPEYMVPSVVFSLPCFPRTAGGKVDRHALPMPEWSNVGRQTYVAPHTPLQKMLTDIWCKVLAVEKVGIHDNFFDLGGHSLLAVQLIAHVRKVIEMPLSLMDLFQSPTVACLAAAIENGRRESEPGMVCLRSGGFLAPLFCFDPTGTHVQAYKPLAVSLEDDRPVWALSLSHIFSGTWQDLSVEVLAERHMRLMRERQPEGPYHLVGWSNGGVLAFAAARQLEQQGEQVAFLGLLDTQPDTAVYEKDPTPVDELLAYIGRERQEAFNAISEKTRDEFRKQLEGLSEDEKLEYAIRWAQEKNFLSIEEAEASIGSLKIGYALARAAALFMSSVRSRPIHSPIHAWWTTNTIARHGSAPMDWSRYTTGAVSVETVIGEHTDAVQSIQVHQRISEILAMKRACGTQKES